MDEQCIAAVDGGFLQSEHWEAFQRALGRTVVRITTDEGSVLMTQYILPIAGGYFFVPRGPICKIRNSKFEIRKVIQSMIEAAKESKAGWVRVEPQTQEDMAMIKAAVGEDYLIIKSKKNHQPAQTLMLDLTRTEDELLVAMKPKTRYNIRLSIKKGVKVSEARDETAIERFCDLVAETARRDNVTAHPRAYYQTMLAAIDPAILKLYVARYENQIIAANLVSFFGGVATYQHGASSNQQRNVMAPFLLQWHAINQARQSGMQRYDFGGTRITNREPHPYNPASPADRLKPESNSWSGITRFKQGFCPSNEPVFFPGCYDIVLYPVQYQTYRFLQGLKDLVA